MWDLHVSGRERIGCVTRTSPWSQPDAGVTPARDYSLHSTPPCDSSQLNILRDSGNTEQAVALPGESLNVADDEHYGNRGTGTAKLRNPKRGRGKRLRGRSYAHPQCVHGLSGNGDGQQRPESPMNQAGVGDEAGRSVDDAGASLPIPCA